MSYIICKFNFNFGQTFMYKMTLFFDNWPLPRINSFSLHLQDVFCCSPHQFSLKLFACHLDWYIIHRKNLNMNHLILTTPSYRVRQLGSELPIIDHERNRESSIVPPRIFEQKLKLLHPVNIPKGVRKDGKWHAVKATAAAVALAAGVAVIVNKTAAKKADDEWKWNRRTENERAVITKLRSKSVSNAAWNSSISFREVHSYFAIPIIFVVCVLNSSSHYLSAPFAALFTRYWLAFAPDQLCRFFLHWLSTNNFVSVTWEMHFRNNNCKKIRITNEL